MGTGRILTFCRAVAALGLTDRDSLYWAGRTAMIGRKEDFEAYDDAFAEWYRSLGAEGALRIELNIPGGDAERQIDWGDEPENLEVTARDDRRQLARRGRRGARARRRDRRSGSWRAAWRCCARSRSPT